MDCSKIDTLLIDFHGVLTDGRQSITQDGVYMFDHIHTRDVRAIREFIARGFQVVIVTASESPIIKHFAEKVQCDLHVTRDKSNLPYHNYMAIGDDAWDVPMLAKASAAFCPLDADTSARKVTGVIWLKTKGGHGVIAELAAKILHL